MSEHAYSESVFVPLLCGVCGRPKAEHGLPVATQLERIEQSQGKLLAGIDALEAKFQLIHSGQNLVRENQSRISEQLSVQIKGLGDGLVDEIRQCFLAGQITKAARPRKRKRSK